MSGNPVKSMLGQLGLTQVRYVKPAPRSSADALVGRVYAQVERDFGVLAPPVALHSPAPTVMAAVWIMLFESLIAPGQVDRPAKETVATAVSVGNECPFCVTIHSRTLAGLNATAGALGLAGGSSGSRTPPRQRRLAEWATACATETGALRSEPVPPDEAPELIGTAVLLHYLNRMVNVFLGEVPLPPRVPRAALAPVMRVVTGLIRKANAGSLVPGTSLDLLPPAPLSEDLSWAAASPILANGYARAFAAIDKAGARVAPEPVRELLQAELSGWQGESRGPSRAWVADAVSALPEPQRPLGQLALLTALAPYQVDEKVIDAGRRALGDDESLIELTAWASLAAARRVGQWIPVGPGAGASGPAPAAHEQ